MSHPSVRITDPTGRQGWGASTIASTSTSTITITSRRFACPLPTSHSASRHVPDQPEAEDRAGGEPRVGQRRRPEAPERAAHFGPRPRGVGGPCRLPLPPFSPRHSRLGSLSSSSRCWLPGAGIISGRGGQQRARESSGAAERGCRTQEPAHEGLLTPVAGVALDFRDWRPRFVA